MKSILAIFVTGIVAVGVWALPPKEKQVHRLPEVQVVAGGSSSSKCPAILPQQEAVVNYFDTLGDSPKPYVHCKVCNTGVLSEHKDNVIRCTYCGISPTDAKNDSPSATVKEASLLQGE